MQEHVLYFGSIFKIRTNQVINLEMKKLILECVYFQKEKERDLFNNKYKVIKFRILFLNQFLGIVKYSCIIKGWYLHSWLNLENSTL